MRPLSANLASSMVNLKAESPKEATKCGECYIDGIKSVSNFIHSPDFESRLDPPDVHPMQISNTTDDIVFTMQQINKIERVLGSPLTLGDSFDYDFIERSTGRIDLKGAAIAPRWNQINENGQIIVPYTFHETYDDVYRLIIVFFYLSVNFVV